ncbi:MAG: hypothetical protein K2X27_07485 [Candidatus Obscuribacterales bacterium]|nr:hypothetical protein [Candidatus Obscuribacterales bacterium]
MRTGKIQNLAILFLLLSLAQCSLLSSPVIAKRYFVKIETQSSFNRFRKIDSLDQVFDDSEVRDSMKLILGEDLGKFLASSKTMEMPEVSGDELYSLGLAPSGSDLKETFFDLNLMSKKICIALLSKESLDVYGLKSIDDAPPALIEYIKDLESRGQKKADA